MSDFSSAKCGNARRVGTHYIIGSTYTRLGMHAVDMILDSECMQ